MRDGEFQLFVKNPETGVREMRYRFTFDGPDGEPLTFVGREVDEAEGPRSTPGRLRATLYSRIERADGTIAWCGILTIGLKETLKLFRSVRPVGVRSAEGRARCGPSTLSSRASSSRCCGRAEDGRLSVGDTFPESRSSRARATWRSRSAGATGRWWWPSCATSADRSAASTSPSWVRHHEEFREAGADVVAVFQYRADPTFHFCRKRGVPFDCLGDPEREGYHAVGLERGGPKEVVGPQLARGFLRAARHGRLPRHPEGGHMRSARARSSSRTEGTVAYAHYHKDSADNPPIRASCSCVRHHAAYASGSACPSR